MCRILIVDNDVNFIKKVRNVLSEFTVLECTHLQEARDIIKVQKPEILMLGFHPDNDIDMCTIQAIAEADYVKDPNHIFAAIDNLSNITIESAYQAGATDCIWKDISAIHLKHRINAIVKWLMLYKTEHAVSEKWRTLWNLLPEPCCLTKLESGIFTYVNYSFLNRIGMTEEQVIGKTAMDLGLIKLPEREMLVNAVKNTPKLEQYEIYYTISGEPTPFSLTSTIIEIHKVKYMLTVCTELTQLMKVRMNNERLRDMVVRTENLKNKVRDIGYTGTAIRAELNAFGMKMVSR